MSEKKRCDMCGKIEDSKKTIFKWTGIRAPWPDWKDICPECSKEVMAFIEKSRESRGVEK